MQNNDDIEQSRLFYLFPRCVILFSVKKNRKIRISGKIKIILLQLDLFGNSGHFLAEELQKLDISRMTPLDAMNCLNELQKKVKGGGKG